MNDPWKLQLLYQESTELMNLFEKNLELISRNIQMLQAFKETVDEYLLEFRELALNNIELKKSN